MVTDGTTGGCSAAAAGEWTCKICARRWPPSKTVALTTSRSGRFTPPTRTSADQKSSTALRNRNHPVDAHSRYDESQWCSCPWCPCVSVTRNFKVSTQMSSPSTFWRCHSCPGLSARQSGTARQATSTAVIPVSVEVRLHHGLVWHHHRHRRRTCSGSQRLTQPTILAQRLHRPRYPPWHRQAPCKMATSLSQLVMRGQVTPAGLVMQRPAARSGQFDGSVHTSSCCVSRV